MCPDSPPNPIVPCAPEVAQPLLVVDTNIGGIITLAIAAIPHAQPRRVAVMLDSAVGVIEERLRAQLIATIGTPSAVASSSPIDAANQVQEAVQLGQPSRVDVVEREMH